MLSKISLAGTLLAVTALLVGYISMLLPADPLAGTPLDPQFVTYSAPILLGLLLVFLTVSVIGPDQLKLQTIFRNKITSGFEQSVSVGVFVASAAFGLATAVAIVGTGVASPSKVLVEPVSATAILVYVPLLVTLLPLVVFDAWRSWRHNRVSGRIVEILADRRDELVAATHPNEVLERAAKSEPDAVATACQQLATGLTAEGDLEAACKKLADQYPTTKLRWLAESVASAPDKLFPVAIDHAVQGRDFGENRKQTGTALAARPLVGFGITLGIMILFQNTVLSSDSLPGDAVAMTLYNFHFLTMLAVVIGMWAGYLRTGRLFAGFKYTFVLCVITLLAFVF